MIFLVWMCLNDFMGLIGFRWFFGFEWLRGFIWFYGFIGLFDLLGFEKIDCFFFSGKRLKIDECMVGFEIVFSGFVLIDRRRRRTVKIGGDKNNPINLEGIILSSSDGIRRSMD